MVRQERFSKTFLVLPTEALTLLIPNSFLNVYQIFEIFITVLFPIAIIVSFGFLADRIFTLDTSSFSKLLIYFTLPALVFSGMSQSSLQTDELWQLTLYTIVTMVILAALSWVLTRLMKLGKKTSSAFILATLLANMGNFGLPFSTFAFGDEGLSRALIIFVISSIVSYTLGIFIASMGTATVKESITNTLKVPLIYATFFGLLINQGYLAIPLSLSRSIDLLGDSAVPVMLFVLGIQLSRTRIRGHLRLIFFGSMVRLIGGPLLGLIIIYFIGLKGLGANVALIQMGMPTAVATTILADEFGSDTQITSSILFVSTMLSFVTLSVLLSLLT